MSAKLNWKRYSVLLKYIVFFLATSTILRLAFFTWAHKEVDLGIIAILRTLVTGAFFDIGILSFFILPFTIYLAIFPNKWTGSKLDKGLIYVGFFLITIIFIFSFFGEITFWEEFKRRYNFIAVDYLIYTYEVIKNINESYPLPILIGGILLLTFGVFFIFKKRHYFTNTFNNTPALAQRFIIVLLNIAVVAFFSFTIDNEDAEWSTNRYNNEISKAGIYSFFAAFRNNELSYKDFYQTLPEQEAFATVKQQLGPADSFIDKDPSHIYRNITDTVTATTPNVILICVESLSADFLGAYGNTDNITPNLDSIVTKSTWFSNMLATGTRTVRGMEALTLSVPPTPGRSIVKREKNQNMFTIASVFKQKQYENTFFYGGDGYFDNMAHFFSGNGFNIVDKSRGLLSVNDISTKHFAITDQETTFENAWGVCDEDLFNKVIKHTDTYTQENNHPFFHFIMTTSNHRPYTYPEGKIDIPSGTGRKGAVKYTDYAIGKFLKDAAKKPWFKNTVVIIVADHCASSAGRWELDVANYHIPAIVYNLPNTQPQEIKSQCSQIDLIPTVLGQLHWSYKSNLFGRNVLGPNNTERAFIGNYRKLGYLKGSNLTILGDGKTANFYNWDNDKNQLLPMPMNTEYLKQTIANYQTADYLYHNNGLNDK